MNVSTSTTPNTLTVEFQSAPPALEAAVLVAQLTLAKWRKLHVETLVKRAGNGGSYHA